MLLRLSGQQVAALFLWCLVQHFSVASGASLLETVNRFISLPEIDFERLWEIWSTRVLVTILIVVVWDYWHRSNQPKSSPQYQEYNNSSRRRPPVMTYEPMKTRNASPTVEPLVDQIPEDRQQEQRENESGTQDGTYDTSSRKGSSRTNESNIKKKTKKAPQPVAASAATNERTPSVPSTPAAPPPIAAKTNHHPGMEGFGHWYDVETSLYRIYTLGRHDGIQVVPPYIPHSYRGKVPINLHVTNQTNTILQVYWVDYKGSHIHKGTLKPNHMWTQQTWIDHPWVFAGLDENDNSTPYLYYVPYRVIPTLPEVPTVLPDDPDTGLHKFAIVPPKSTSSPYYVAVHDDVLPFPADVHFTSPTEGIAWTLQHMSRVGRPWDDPTVDLIQKYLTNIINAPETTKYRQLRIRSLKFGSIWNSPLQGLLLAVGFVEVQGYAELGCADKPLSRERIQDLALLSYMIAQWRGKEKQKDRDVSGDNSRRPVQPEGADGYGRAGFGRAGMN